MTLAYEDDNSKLVEVVTVVDIDDEKHVDNSLVQIWKINLTMIACHMEAKYIYTYVGLTTMI